MNNSQQLHSTLVYHLDEEGEKFVSLACLTHFQHHADSFIGPSSLPLLVAQIIEKEQRGHLSSGWREPGTVGDFKVIRSENHQVVYGRGTEQDENIVLVVVSGLDYPGRFAIQFLHAVYKRLLGKNLQNNIKNSIRETETREELSSFGCDMEIEPVLQEVCTQYERLPSLLDTQPVTGTLQEQPSTNFSWYESLTSFLEPQLITDTSQEQAPTNLFTRDDSTKRRWRLSILKTVLGKKTKKRWKVSTIKPVFGRFTSRKIPREIL